MEATTGAGKYRVYKSPQPGHLYVLGGDPSKGLERGDDSVAGIWDCTVGECAAVWEGREEPHIQADAYAKLARWYQQDGEMPHRLRCGVEWNDQGLVVNNEMARMGCDMQMSQSLDKATSQFENRLGIVNSKANRTRMITEDLLPMVSTLDAKGMPVFKMPFYKFWQQAKTFENIGKGEDVKMAGAAKHHDDWVLMAVYMIHTAKQRYNKAVGVRAEDYARTILVD